MRTHLSLVVAILAAGSTVAVVANTSWYRMEWVREEIKNASTAPTQPSDSDEGDLVKDAPQGPNDHGPNNHGPEEGCIRIDDVLEHLANKTAFFVDAREQNEYDESHLRGAILVPASDIFGNVENCLMATGVFVTDLVIVYCGSRTCDASHDVADSLRRDFSFENVLIYKNGWEEIEASGRFDDYIVVGGES
jgi:rhodanese-related sulfurtransferase